MNQLIKPAKLNKGDTVATVSISNGWSGDKDIKWKYNLGVERLEMLGLNVVAAPNSMKGSDYLTANPEARAEDIMWTFSNPNIKAIIANVGGNDSIKAIPYIDPNVLKHNPKIFIGYSDVMNLHLLCYKCGFSSFYGDNLLYPIAEAQGWHNYSKHWFEKVLFDNSTIGDIVPSTDWTFEETNYTDPNYMRNYYSNNDYEVIQGRSIVRGKLFGGHTGLMDLKNTVIETTAQDYKDSILFIEDIPEFFTPDSIENFLKWLDSIGALHVLKGIVIGKLNQNVSFELHKEAILKIMRECYLTDLPILYGLNFGHSSPICILPYGAMAEIDCDKKAFTIVESGVV